MLHQYELTEIT